MNPKILKRITAVITSIVLVVTCYGSTFKEICAFAEEISTESINADELIKCGDLNSDGQINVFDVMRAKRDILNKNPQPTRIADINDDGAFNIQDAMILQDYVLLRDVSKYKKLGQNSESEELSNDYKYSVFSGSGSGTEGITLTGEEIIVNSNIASNGNIEISGECLIQPHSSVSENANVLPLYMDSKIMNAYFSDSETYDEFTVEQGDEINYIIEKPLISYGDINIHKELTLDKTCMMAYNSITINNNTINNGDTVLYSKYGDISIDGSSITLDGLIYAPSGTVKLSAKNITINGIIIAKHVIMEASEKINIDSNPELAKFIGVDSENLFIPYSEWEYIKKDDAEVFPEIVKEQIYNNPLSVDDEWLRINYGDEVFEAYDAEMKKQLVEALYIGQSKGICNYWDIISTLDCAVKNNYNEQVKLYTKLPDENNPDGQLTIRTGNVLVQAELNRDPDFIGPIYPYYGPYKWEYYVNVEENPDIKDEIQKKDKDKKKFEINDLNAFAFLTATGLTIGSIGKTALDTVSAGISGIALKISDKIKAKLTSIKPTADKFTSKLSEEIIKTVNSVFENLFDIDLLQPLQTCTPDGRQFSVGPLKIDIYNETDTWKNSISIADKIIDTDIITQNIGADNIEKISQLPSEIYNNIVSIASNTADPSKISGIISHAVNSPQEFITGYYEFRDFDITCKYIDITQKYGSELIDSLSEGLRNNAVEIISYYGDDAANAIKLIGNDAVSALNKCNNKEKAIQFLNTFDGKTTAKALRNCGDEALSAIETYPSKEYIQLIADYKNASRLAIDGGQKTVDAVLKLKNASSKSVNNFLQTASNQTPEFLKRIEKCNFTDDAVKLIGKYKNNENEINIFNLIYDKDVKGLGKALDSSQTTVTFALNSNYCFVETSGTTVPRFELSCVPNDFFKGLSSSNEIVHKYSEIFTDEFVDKMEVSNDIKSELKLLNEAINKTRRVAEKEGMLYGKDALIAYPWDEYSLETGWTVYNCGEVWSAREAIIHGVRFNDLQFVSIFRESGKIREMCKNCTVTFKNKTAL